MYGNVSNVSYAQIWKTMKIDCKKESQTGFQKYIVGIAELTFRGYEPCY